MAEDDGKELESRSISTQLPCNINAAQSPCNCFRASPDTKHIFPTTSYVYRNLCGFWPRFIMAALQPASSIKTRLLIISDTHGQRFDPPNHSVDVVIHCGDLTEHSKIDEYRTTIRLLEEIDAPLKLVIAGNHDFTLDSPIFKQKLEEAERIAGEPLDTDLVRQEFGDYGESRALFASRDARDKGITFLDEGTHTFSLANGARLKVYASPFTPSNHDSSDWAFQYRDSHNFEIEAGTDIAITHGPPRGIMDLTKEKRIGCPSLFAAIAKAQPQLHCFGHVHNGWGAKVVAWRPQISDHPTHFSDIDNGGSVVIDSLAKLNSTIFDSPDDEAKRQMEIDHYRRQRCRDTSHCQSSAIGPGRTLFVNAAVKGDEGLNQLPWVAEIDLPLNMAEGT